jgi:hypothetical protein
MLARLAVVFVLACFVVSTLIVPTDAIGCYDGHEEKNLRYYAYSVIMFAGPIAAALLVFGAVLIMRPGVPRSGGRYVAAVIASAAAFAVVCVLTVGVVFFQVMAKGCVE